MKTPKIRILFVVMMLCVTNLTAKEQEIMLLLMNFQLINFIQV